MAESLMFRVYDNSRKHQASCSEVEAAAVLVSFYGVGSTIRVGRTGGRGPTHVVWVEGGPYTATDSYDRVAETVYRRLSDIERAKKVRAANVPATEVAHA